MQKNRFGYIYENRKSKSSDRSGIVWDGLTVLVILTTLVIAAIFIITYINPDLDLNLFPFPATPIRPVVATPTPTIESLVPPSWTPKVDPTSLPSSTPEPTNMPEPTEEEQDDGDEGDDEEFPEEDFPVVLHQGSPQYIPSISFHPELGCGWLGVAGQVIDVDGAPLPGLIIEVGGLLGGNSIGNPTLLQVTGLATAYGNAGYEVQLADEPIESTGTLWIQVLDQEGLFLSDKVYFDTYEDCQSNLVVIYFQLILE